MPLPGISPVLIHRVAHQVRVAEVRVELFDDRHDDVARSLRGVPRLQQAHVDVLETDLHVAVLGVDDDRLRGVVERPLLLELRVVRAAHRRLNVAKASASSSAVSSPQPVSPRPPTLPHPTRHTLSTHGSLSLCASICAEAPRRCPTRRGVAQTRRLLVGRKFIRVAAKISPSSASNQREPTRLPPSRRAGSESGARRGEALWRRASRRPQSASRSSHSRATPLYICGMHRRWWS